MSCKSCGKDDHIRRSSTKCINHIKPQKYRINSINYPTEQYVIKTGLKKFIKDHTLITQIEQDVHTMSSMMIEASLLAHYTIIDYCKTNSIPELNQSFFLSLFYSLQVKCKGKHILDVQSYMNIRNLYLSKLYDCKKIAYLIHNAAGVLETNTKNNVLTHLYSRVKRYFKTLASKDEVRIIMKSLFSNVQCDNVHLVQFKANISNLPFINIEKEWWLYLLPMYKIQQYFIANNYKSFNLCPVFKHGRHHVRYNSNGLRDLLRSKDTNFRGNSRFYWEQTFRITKYERKEHSFASCFSTDGINVSIHMLRRKKEHRVIDWTNVLSKAKSFIGIDPGVKYMYGMVKDEENFLLKSSAMKYKTQDKSRLALLSNKTKHIKDIECSTPSKKSNFIDYLHHRLKHLAILQSVYTKKIIARLKWDSFIQRQKVIDHIANKICQDKPFIAYGNGKSAQFIKGYAKPPLTKLFNALKCRTSVYLVDEFRTTKLCSKCNSICHTSSSPHRFQVCKNCKGNNGQSIVWNRDINAARNILAKGISFIKTGDVQHSNFNRKTKSCSIVQD
jgi:transposase